MEDKISNEQRSESASSNTNTTTGIVGVPTQVYQVPVVEIHEDSDGGEKPYPNMDAEYDVTAQNVGTEISIVAKTINKEEGGETEEDKRYPSRKIHKIAIYEPIFQGKCYEDGSIVLVFEDTLESLLLNMTIMKKYAH